MKASSKRGFTVTEVMVVVALIGLMGAVAVPSFVKARAANRRNACIANLRQIQNAKLVWAREKQRKCSATPADKDLFGPDRYLREKPLCPAGGSYTLTPVEAPAMCSLAAIEGHTL